MPQFYLRQWCDSGGELWRYGFFLHKGVHERRAAPKSTGAKADLFAIRDITGRNRRDKCDDIEKRIFVPIDNSGAQVLQALIRDPFGLPDDTRMAWAVFVNSLLERDPRRLLERDATATDLALKLRNQMGLERIVDEERAASMATNEVRNLMVREVLDEKVLKYLVSMTWMVASASDDLFITSDSPIVVNGGKSRTPLHMLSMPLSPRHLLVMYPSAWTMDEDFLRLLVLSHNFLLLDGSADSLYSAGPIQDTDLLKLRTAVFEGWRRPRRR